VLSKLADVTLLLSITSDGNLSSDVCFDLFDTDMIRIEHIELIRVSLHILAL